MMSPPGIAKSQTARRSDHRRRETQQRVLVATSWQRPTSLRNGRGKIFGNAGSWGRRAALGARHAALRSRPEASVRNEATSQSRAANGRLVRGLVQPQSGSQPLRRSSRKNTEVRKAPGSKDAARRPLRMGRRLGFLAGGWPAMPSLAQRDLCDRTPSPQGAQTHPRVRMRPTLLCLCS